MTAQPEPCCDYEATDAAATIANLAETVKKQDATLAAVLSLHTVSVAMAGELVPGECIYCQERPELELIRRYRGWINDEKTKRWVHDHRDPYPTCVTCAGYGYDMCYADWPCSTAAALGVSA